MPRQWRSGWHLMWPYRAFHDQNFLPHSVQGCVISGLLVVGFEEPPRRRNLVRFFLGLLTAAAEEVDGFSFMVTTHLLSMFILFSCWWGKKKCKKWTRVYLCSTCESGYFYFICPVVIVFSYEALSYSRYFLPHISKYLMCNQKEFIIFEIIRQNTKHRTI